jgi:hypothetical protein
MRQGEEAAKSSGLGRGLRDNAEGEASDVIMLARIPCEVVEFGHQEIAEKICGGGSQGTHEIQKARFAELISLIVEGFDDAVGENDQRIALLERDFTDFIVRFRLDAERHAAAVEAIHATGDAEQDRSVMAGVYVAKRASLRIEFGQKCGGEAASFGTVSARILIELGDEFSER